jgi:hypothetical protein
MFLEIQIIRENLDADCRITAQNAPSRTAKGLHAWDFLRLHKDLLTTGRLYTDGSYTPVELEENGLFSIPAANGHSACAIICINAQDWRTSDIIAITITEHEDVHVDRAYTTELIGLLGAHQILACMNIRQQHNCIMTDCQAAQKAVNGNNTQ